MDELENKVENQIMVSIRCAAYNHEPYIRQCLEGFVMQQTNFRFEAIVHDDASTDGTAAIIREYAEKYPDIIKPIFETENQYSKHDGSLRRIMDAEMRGKYIAMCEGDDYWTDPLKLQKQVDFMETHEEYGFIGAECSILMNGRLQKDIDWFEKRDYLVENGIGLVGNVFEYAIYGPVTRTCTLLYRKKILDAFPCAPCGDLTLEAMLAHESLFARVEEPCCVYRVHSGGLSNSRSFNGQLRYHQWNVNNRRLLHQLFPEKCQFDEQEFMDRETYIRLKKCVHDFQYKKALFYRGQICSYSIRNKAFVKYLRGPISFFLLYIKLRLSE